MGHKANDLDSQLAIVWASAACGLGNGVLTLTATTAKYAAPGESAGAEVTITDGQIQIIPSDTATKFLVLTRSGTDDLTVGDVDVWTDGLISANEELAGIQAAILRTLKAVAAGQGDERIQRETLANLQKRETALLRRKAGEDQKAGLETGSPSISYVDFSQG